MCRIFFGFVAATFLSFGQNPVPLERILNFEGAKADGPPPGWSAPTGTAFIDDKVFHGGNASARIERHPGSPGQFNGILYSMPIEFTGKTVEFCGYLRSSEVSGGVIAMWMRVDTASGSAGFKTTEGEKVSGTNDWKEYRISLPLAPEGERLFFGVLLTGTGTMWADDLQLLVDGKPIAEAPKRPVPKTVLTEDTEFENGSRVPQIESLSAMQARNLVTLGMVWGFVKYHHPLITAGRRHWDYDLFRVLPAILAAPDRNAANAAILKWIDALGEVAACKQCAKLTADDLHLRPDVAWIDDKASLGTELSARLREIYTNRPASGGQFYATQARGVGNPVFDHELSYRAIKFPDAGMQLLTLYRYWNIIRYWFPYRDMIGENWDNVLAEVLPRFVLAHDYEAFQNELLKLIVRVNDTHAGFSGANARPPQGTCQLPVVTRFIGERAVVSGYAGDEAGKASGVKPGDVITAIDGKPVSELMKEWWPYYSASNEPTRLRDIGRNLTRGTCGPATVHIQRGAESIELKTARVTPPSPPPGFTHDLPGDTFQRLSPQIGYLKLSSIKVADVSKYIDAAAGTKGLIIDIRNYPSEFVVFALGNLLVDHPTEFVRFTAGDLTNPGAFHWTPPITLEPAKPHYAGKVVILVDEVSLSQAEYTTMALRTAPGAKVIGSTTAGADGNVSPIPLPFGLATRISGIGVFYPDKRPTQRLGILADLEVKPTIEGLRDGRDELIEAAKREILK
jgi:C-terminal processing protease CtpA/Prc